MANHRADSSTTTPKPRRGWLSRIPWWLIIPVLVGLVLRLFVFGVFTVPSASMHNTLLEGDYLATLNPRLAQLHRGDVVVFKDPGGWLTEEQYRRSPYLVKRLIGLPGDTVACEGAGHPVTVNGAPVDESAYLPPDTDPSDIAFHVKVSDGSVFVLGDNRAHSADSRYHSDDGRHGLVPIANVSGIGLVVYWPVAHWSWL